jgi:hypothetical protein
MTDSRVSKANVVFGANTSALDAALAGIQAKLGKLNAITGTSFGLLGVGLSVDALVQFTGQAIQAGNALTTMQASVRAVAGSQEAYDRIVQVATANQSLFGGSLEQNLGTMQQFSFIANRTGVDLKELNDVAQLLALVNPFEGFEGAGFALGELFAGDITSIVERFNLSRTAVRDLIDESRSASEVIDGLTALLAQQGITSEVLAAKTDTVAQTYLTLGNNVSNAISAMGQEAAKSGEPVVRFLNNLIDTYKDLVPVLDDVQKRTEKQGLSEQRLLDAIQTGNLATVIAAFIDYGNVVMEADEAARALNISVVQGATSYDQYVSSLNNALSSITEASVLTKIQYEILTEAQFVYLQALLRQGVATEEAVSQALEFGKVQVTNAEGTTYTTERTTALAEAQDIYAESVRNAAVVARAHSGVLADSAGYINTSELATNALKDALNDATKAMFAAANANLSLDEQAQQAAMALLGAGEAGRLAALRLAGSTSDIDKLIARYYNLAVAAQSARNASVVSGMELGLIGPSTPVVVPPRTVVTTGGGGGGGGTGPTSVARDQADELQRIAERHQERMIRAEETYQQRLLRITEDYAKRRREANQDYSDQQFEDRAGFYRQLMNIEDQAIRQQASAEYEALALEATQIRDALGADVAAEYLAEAGRIAAARAQRADEIRKARQDGDKNLEYLLALDEMEREVEDRRLKRAESGEASIAAQEEEDRQEAAVQLQEDIKNAADDAGKALLKAQQDANAAIGTTNEALQKQVDLLGQIGGRPVTTGTTTTTTPTTTAPTIAGAAGGSSVAVFDAAVAQALAGVRDAVNAVERAVSRIPTRSAVGGG